MKYISAFFIMLVVDYAWSVYIRSAAERKAVKASITSAVIFLSSSLLTIEFVEDRWILIPAMLGGIVGTYLSVSRGKS